MAGSFRRGLRLAVPLAVLVPALALPAGSAAKSGSSEQGSSRDKKAFFDSRQTPKSQQELQARAAKLDDSPSPALSSLKDSLGREGIATIDPLTSTPRMVGRTDGFLTGPSGAEASSIAMGYVSKNADAFGLDAAALASLKLARDYVSVDGTHHLSYVQSIGGVPVFGNGLKANVTKDGRLINLVGSPLASLATATSSPAISEGEAVAAAKRDVGLTTIPLVADKAAKVYFRTVSGTRIAYQTIVGSAQEQYQTVVDGTSGAILYRRSLVNYASAQVLDYYPNAPSGGTRRSVSFDQWLTPNAVNLTGPNVHVYSDVNDSNDAQTTEETLKDGTGNFNYAFTQFFPAACVPGFPCSWNPQVANSWQTNKDQSASQLFFFINTFHDHLAAAPIGFTKAAGNFEGDDPVFGENLDGANTAAGLPDGQHVDNANFGTPPDGNSPRMQMFLWHQPNTAFPAQDPFIATNGSDEADIVYHENTHGLSNRLVVDAQGNSTLGGGQAGAMGEAWSDWYAMDFLVDQGFQADNPSVDGEVRIGPYVGWGNDLIRFEPIDCSVGAPAASCPGGVATGPGGFTYGDYGKVAGAPEVHSDGEIWGQTLWDLRKAVGSLTAESLITRAMELSPANPSFLDMRNSILQADEVAGGANHDTIWSVFAKRGLGYFAGAFNGDDLKPVEDFSLPPPGNPFGKLKGSISDTDTGNAIDGAVVAFGGHASGFPGDLAGVTKKNGTYEVKKIPFGTYPKIFASAPGYDSKFLDSLAIDQPVTTLDFTLRRDWAALGGGAAVTAFDGPDFTSFGCGPTGAIDQSLGNGWGSITSTGFTADGNVTPKSVTIKLPVAVDIVEIAIDPSNTCGDPGSSATHHYTVHTSTDGTTFTLANEGHFYAANRGKLNTVTPLATGSTSSVRYIRFTMINPMVPETGNACTDATNCGDNGVPTRCGPAPPNPGNFGGCTFMDMSEIEVYGKPS